MQDNRSSAAQSIAFRVISGLCSIGIYRQSPLSNNSKSEQEWKLDQPVLIGLGVIFSKEAYRLYGDFRSESYIVEGSVNQATSLVKAARLAEACKLGQEAVVSARQYNQHTKRVDRLHQSLDSYARILRNAGRLDDAYAILADNIALWRLEYARDPSTHCDKFSGRLQRHVEAALSDGRLAEACVAQAELVAVRREEHFRNGWTSERWTLGVAVSRHIGILKAIGNSQDLYEALEAEVAFQRRLYPLNRESNATTLASALRSLGAFLADAGYEDRSRKAYSRACRVLQRAIVVIRKRCREDPSRELSQTLASLLEDHAQALHDAPWLNEQCDVFGVACPRQEGNDRADDRGPFIRLIQG